MIKIYLWIFFFYISLETNFMCQIKFLNICQITWIAIKLKYTCRFYCTPEAIDNYFNWFVQWFTQAPLFWSVKTCAIFHLYPKVIKPTTLLFSNAWPWKHSPNCDRRPVVYHVLGEVTAKLWTLLSWDQFWGCRFHNYGDKWVGIHGNMFIAVHPP